jgi:hypothetical protein
MNVFLAMAVMNVVIAIFATVVQIAIKNAQNAIIVEIAIIV